MTKKDKERDREKNKGITSEKKRGSDRESDRDRVRKEVGQVGGGGKLSIVRIHQTAVLAGGRRNDVLMRKNDF